LDHIDEPFQDEPFQDEPFQDEMRLVSLRSMKMEYAEPVLSVSSDNEENLQQQILKSIIFSLHHNALIIAQEMK
jgi:hypothetical protein